MENKTNPTIVKDGTVKTYHSNGNIASMKRYKNDVLHGVFKEYDFDVNEQVRISGNYKNNERHGTVTFYDEREIWQTQDYKHGKLHGYITTYRNGKITMLAKFFDDEQHGLTLFYNDDGKITKRVMYSHNNKIS